MSDPFLRGSRLTVLRDLRGLTQADLAATLDVTPSFVSLVEKGERALPFNVAERASRHYSLPMSFFEVGQGVTNIGHHTFRKKSKATMRDERRVKGAFDEAARLFQAASMQSGYRTADLPPSAELDVEDTAREIRRSAGLDDLDPVPNLVRLIEKLGIGVLVDLAPDLAEADHSGISRPSRLNDRPLIATAVELPGAVQRFTLGHELAHVIFDQDLAAPIRSTRSPQEQRAFRFAGALLLPEKVVRERVSPSLSLHGYLPIKADYGVSVGAILKRAADLDVITPERYRSLSIQLSSQGWRYHEPVDVAVEVPLLLPQALNRIYGKRVRSVIHDLGLDPLLVSHWLNDDAATDHTPAAGATILSLHDRAPRR